MPDEVRELLLKQLYIDDLQIKILAANALATLADSMPLRVQEVLTQVAHDEDDVRVVNSTLTALANAGQHRIWSSCLESKTNRSWLIALANVSIRQSAAITVTGNQLTIYEHSAPVKINTGGQVKVTEILEYFFVKFQRSHLPARQIQALMNNTSVYSGCGANSVFKSRTSTGQSLMSVQNQNALVPSAISSALTLSKQIWVVSILRKPYGKNPDHTYLIVEGLNQPQKGMSYCYHLVTDEERAGYSKILVKEISDVAAGEMKEKILKDFLHYEDFYAMSWNISTRQAEKLHNLVLVDEKDPPRYLLSGDRSIIAKLQSKEGHNCFTWARAKLLSLGDSRINIPLKKKDYLVAKTSFYLDARGGSANQNVTKCTMM